MRVPGGGAVGNHGDGQGRRVRGVVGDLDVEHGSKAAESLRADAEGVGLVEQLDAQLFDLVPRAARLELCHVDVVHQRFLGEEHRLLGRAADADAEDPGGHQPEPIVGTVLSTQSTVESLGFSMTNLDLFSEPPPLAASLTSTVSPGTISKCTTAGVLSRVFFRVKAGSVTMDARSTLSGCR